MAIAGGNISLDSTEGMDRITQTEKVTSPYFSDGSTTLAAANIVSPFVYFQIIAATFVGYYLFGAVPNKMTWIGIFIITGAGIYIALREIKLEQKNLK